MNDVEEAKHELAIAANDAIRTIATAAEAASNRIVAAAAAAAAANSSETNSKDHDLLIELKTLMTGLKEDVKGLKDDTARRINNLEINKLDCKESYTNFFKKDVDKALYDDNLRLKSLENSRAEQKGKASVSTVIIMFIANLILSIGVAFIINKLGK